MPDSPAETVLLRADASLRKIIAIFARLDEAR